MKQKKENRVALLLHWAGGQKIWLFLAILLSMCSGLCIIVPYIGIYRLMDATFNNACTKELVVQTVAMIAAAVTLRFALFGCSGVAAHKGAYGALFKVRCMVAEHMARVPLGALNERRTGDIKTVLNEDIEKLELFLAHNLPDLVCYLVGPVVIFIYLMTVNIPLALISLVPLILAVVVMGMMFRNTDDLMERANRSITTLNSVMIEYISGMKLIKAYNMGSKSFQKFSGAIQEENAMWNETSRRMGPPYAAFVVIIECGMLLMVPIGGMFFLRGSLAASAFLLFVYVGSMYLTEIRPLQELGTNFANVLNAVTKTKEILDIPIYEGGTDFPQNHDIELRNADKADCKWSATTIIRILQDETYTGTLVQGKQGTPHYKIKQMEQRPASEWVRVPDAHEALIARQDFDLVQRIKGLDTRTSPNEDTVYLFSGILICGCCGSRMTRKTNRANGKEYHYYYCPTGKKKGCAHPVMLKESSLIDCVRDSLKAYIGNIASLEALLTGIPVSSFRCGT